MAKGDVVSPKWREVLRDLNWQMNIRCSDS